MDYNTEDGWWGNDLPSMGYNLNVVKIHYEEGGWFFPTPDNKRIVVRELEEKLANVKVA